MLVLLAVALWFGSTEHAFAYLDPGTGSILLQAIIGGVATGLFIVRSYWRKIRNLFGGPEAGELSGKPLHDK
ncbi:MAG: hypothetical protein ACREDW_06320 [Aestuariivirgaceae bacterium]